MSGFMSSSTALTICKADSAASLDLDALRQHAFTPEIDADGRRFGWVGLGDPLDTDGFELASVDALRLAPGLSNHYTLLNIFIFPLCGTFSSMASARILRRCKYFGSWS